jgi:phosphatidylserine/phosphatidylglycerophosphate/cardiolipin synthase-like enzyme
MDNHVSFERITDQFFDTLQTHSNASRSDDPHYWLPDPKTLVSRTSSLKFKVGTGFQLLSSIFSECEVVRSEIIIVTCFWAKSSSQMALVALLRKLSTRAVEQDRTIQIRLCFSSRSIPQKLFQTSSVEGKIYPPSSWVDMGLPSFSELPGVEMVVKSIFVRPFSIMHPKFIIVDRELAFMPSCNISWENWFEGSLELTGDIVRKLFDFWVAFWERGNGPVFPSLGSSDGTTTGGIQAIYNSEAGIRSGIQTTTLGIPSYLLTILLPSPHHINPHFRFLLSSPSPPPPPTPLNTFLLQIIREAKQSIYIQTPNITCFPVIEALFAALRRGVHVHIVTNRKLMILEQLVTAGTITEYEIWKFSRRYQRLLKDYTRNSDLENPMIKPGILNISYYKTRERPVGYSEPVKSHLKLTMVDECITVLGSGNMDRASWYTSQELGIAIISANVTRDVKVVVEKGLDGRLATAW